MLLVAAVAPLGPQNLYGTQLVDTDRTYGWVCTCVYVCVCVCVCACVCVHGHAHMCSSDVCDTVRCGQQEVCTEQNGMAVCCRRFMVRGRRQIEEPECPERAGVNRGRHLLTVVQVYYHPP